MEITKDEMQKRSNITKKKPVNNNNNNSNDKIKSSNTFVVSDVSDGIVTLVSNCLHVLDFIIFKLIFPYIQLIYLQSIYLQIRNYYQYLRLYSI